MSSSFVDSFDVDCCFADLPTASSMLIAIKSSSSSSTSPSPTSNEVGGLLDREEDVPVVFGVRLTGVAREVVETGVEVAVPTALLATVDCGALEAAVVAVRAGVRGFNVEEEAPGGAIEVLVLATGRKPAFAVAASGARLA